MQWATRIHHRRQLAKIPEEQHNRESTPQWQWRTDLGCKLPLIENIRSRLRQLPHEALPNHGHLVDKQTPHAGVLLLQLSQLVGRWWQKLRR
jgi:hypothetical protein